jgi:hypothetical protein
MPPSPRAGWLEPEEIADVVVFLAGDGGSYLDDDISPMAGLQSSVWA